MNKIQKHEPRPHFKISPQMFKRRLREEMNNGLVPIVRNHMDALIFYVVREEDAVRVPDRYFTIRGTKVPHYELKYPVPVDTEHTGNYDQRYVEKNFYESEDEEDEDYI